MFVAGSLSPEWQERLEDMIAVKEEVVDVLDQGKDCSQAWRQGYALAEELGHANNLMGMAPDQSRFLGHSVGLQLDESPVVAEGFDRPLPIGGTMAIEPKVIFAEGAVGIEDCWFRDKNGLQCLSSGNSFPSWTEW